MMTNKFCSDCKWRKVSLIDRLLFGASSAAGFAKCLHASALQVNTERLRADALVTGALRKLEADDYSYCTTNRLHSCRSDGKFWERK